MSKAIDVAAKELISVANPGESSLPYLFLIQFCLMFFFFQTFHIFAYYCYSLSFLLCAVDQIQLDRAKQATKSAILMNLESRVCIVLYDFLI